MIRETPMMRQYVELKEQAQGCILFFRMGDFYEMFGEDAKVASRVLAIALTSRDKSDPNPIPMCGVPFRAVDNYLAKMVDAGYKVAIADQVEDPKLAKGLVRREITRVVTPGMFTDPNHLPAKDNRFLASLCFAKGQVGLAFLDLASGEFRATSLEPGPPLNDELARVEPAELVLAESQMAHAGLARLSPDAAELPRSSYPGNPPSLGQARDILGRRLPEDWDQAPTPALIAAAMAWGVVTGTQRRTPDHVESLEPIPGGRPSGAGRRGRRNLELFRSIAGGTKKGSLLGAVDQTSTPMGGGFCGSGWVFPSTTL
jgi:DNA mismatch repair protein MutS